MLSHHETAGFFPSGGWGWYLVGDPDRGTGRNQPGGWCYAVLPYLDQKPLYQMGAGMTDAQKMVVNATRIATAVPTFNCPSRRRTVVEVSTSDAPYNSNPAPYAAKTDYAANSGYPYPYYPYSVQGPPTIAQGDAWTAQNAWPDLSAICQGIVYLRSQVSIAMIHDGASNTYMLGEKYSQSAVLLRRHRPGGQRKPVLRLQQRYEPLGQRLATAGRSFTPDQCRHVRQRPRGQFQHDLLRRLAARHIVWHRRRHPSAAELHQRRRDGRPHEVLKRRGEGDKVRTRTRRLPPAAPT